MAMPLSDPRKELFCQRRAMAILTLEEPFQSWLEVYGDDDEREEPKQKASCSNLMSNQDIKNRIDQIGGSVIAKQEKRLEFTLEKALDFCHDVVSSRPSEASMDNPLCELKMSKQGPYATFPDKLGVLSLLTKLKGWNQDMNISVNIPSWSPSQEANITEPVIDGVLVEPSLPAPETQDIHESQGTPE